jgi:hypothetical protein
MDELQDAVAHALEHEPLEERRLLIRVGPQALIFRFRHDGGVEADIALALDELVDELPVPVIGVIDPGARCEKGRPAAAR